MATAVGDLVIKMNAMTAPAEKGIQRVSKQLATMGPAAAIAGTATGKALGIIGAGFRGLVGVAKRVGGAIAGAFMAIPRMIGRGIKSVLKFGAIITGLGGAGGLAGMGLLVKGQMAAIDATAKLADRVGITTKALAGLRHAAEITGAGTEKLDKGLMFMAKSLGEAKTGTGEAGAALEILKLSAADLIAMSPDQAFRAIGDAMQGLATQSEKTFVATRLFGRGGMSLVNTLALGTAGLDEMQREAERLGIAFNRIDAAKVEAANDAITRMKTAIKGVAGTAAIALAPMIEAYVDSITAKVPIVVKWIRKVSDVAGKVWGYVATGFQTAWQYIVDTLVPFQDAFRSAFQTVVAHLDVMLGSWQGFREGIIHLSVQASLAFQTIWEHVKHWFINTTTHTVSYAQAAWSMFSDWLTDTFSGRVVSGFALAGIELAKGLLGPTISMVPDLLAKIGLLQKAAEGANLERAAPALARGASTALATVGKALQKLEKRAADRSKGAIASEAERHQAALAGFGGRRAQETEDWKKRMGELPKFSDLFKDATEGKIPGFAGIGGPEFGAMPGEGAATETKFSGALERGSAEAYSSILKAFDFQKKPEQRTEENTRAIARNTTETNRQLGDIGFMLKSIEDAEGMEIAA